MDIQIEQREQREGTIYHKCFCTIVRFKINETFCIKPLYSAPFIFFAEIKNHQLLDDRELTFLLNFEVKMKILVRQKLD